MRSIRVLVCLLFVLLALLPAAKAQSITGQISGRVVDSQGAVVVGATVKLTAALSEQVHEFKTEANGSFIFTGLIPGAYSLHIAQPGFQTYDQNAITVSAQERVNLSDITLAIGDVRTIMEVQATAVHVATDSSDRSVAIGITQIADTPVRGRNPLSLIMTLPGVQTLESASDDNRGWGGRGIPPVNGGQTGQIIFNLDGVNSQDSGNLNPGYLGPSVDAIAEVKLLVSNYTAEYGGRTGGQYTMTTKNGTNQFHGSAYYYWRHEQFNANEWFNNKLNVTKPRYRYNNPGGTIGGPLIIPGTSFNRSRTKLFFFFLYDYTRNKNIATNTFTMPSALERTGDFSQTVTTQGVMVPIYDPTTKQPFPGNKIPTTQISPAGLAMMNLFPLPDPAGLALDPTGQRRYNFRATLPQSRPNEDKILRVDYNIRQKDAFYVRLIQDYQAFDGYGGTVGPPSVWGQFPHSYHVQSAGAMGSWVHTFTPTMINEVTWGINRGKQGVNALSNYTTTAVGGAKTYADSTLPLKDANGNVIPLPRINQTSNYLKLLPSVNFGLPPGFSAQSSGQGISSAPAFSLDNRWPFVGTDQLETISNKTTWIKGAHIIKAGLYIERMARNVSMYSTYSIFGSYYFGSDRGAALDTNYPYSNLLTGAIFGYGDDNQKKIEHPRYTQVEWFAQDTWKIARRVTVDVGLRFYRVGDLYSSVAQLGMFRKEEFNAAKSGQLLFPACALPTTGVCPAANKIAINPATGAVFPYVRQGTFDTSSYAAGSYPWSGMHFYDKHVFNVPPIQLGPRLGIAWDVFGNGKTAIRSGFGTIVGRNWSVAYIGSSGIGTGPLAAPPDFLAPIILYTSFQNLANAQSYYTPQNVFAGGRDEKVQTTYNWTFGIQQNVGRGMILDASYVANAMRHGWGTSYDFNAVPPYTTWTPTTGAVSKYIDPTSGAFYSANLIRSMVGYNGYGQMPTWTYLSASSYNSLQVQLNRRSGNIQWNLNYTWQKTLYNQNNMNYQWVDGRLGRDITNRKHAVNFNFGYGIPRVSRLLKDNVVAKLAFDGWRLNGNGAIYSGNPFGVSCSAQNAPAGYWTGTPTGGIPFRCQMGNNIWLPSGQYASKTEDPGLQWGLNPANFTLPPATSLGVGNTPPSLFFGPGVFDVDLSLAKEFRVFKESRSLEIRAETFNTLNHFNPGNPSTSLTYNFVTSAQTNSSFGTISSAQVQARRMILSARFKF